MVRLAWICSVLVLAGCSAARDAFSAHAQVAGTAAGQTLTVDRLAHVVGHAQRGQFVPAFDSAAWTLPPGAMTAVVRTPFGFHIIRRPPLAEVRDSFRVDLENARTAQLDSLYLDSLAKQRQLKIESGALALVRQAVPQIVSARSDNRTLATYHGGTFQVRDLARWLLALDPNDVRGISTATDAQ